MSHATVQRNTQKLPHAAQELDVPPDGNCFYYAVGLAYLYPKIGGPVAFGKACDTLFHREGHEDVFNSEEIRQVLIKNALNKPFDLTKPSYERRDPSRAQSDFLSGVALSSDLRKLKGLLNDTFRNKIADTTLSMQSEGEAAQLVGRVNVLNHRTSGVWAEAPQIDTAVYLFKQPLMIFSKKRLFMTGDQQAAYLSTGSLPDSALVSVDQSGENYIRLNSGEIEKYLTSGAIPQVASRIDDDPSEVRARRKALWIPSSELPALSLIATEIFNGQFACRSNLLTEEEKSGPPLCITNIAFEHYRFTLNAEDYRNTLEIQQAFRSVPEASSFSAAGGAGAGTAPTASTAMVFSKMTIDNSKLMTALEVRAPSYKEEGGLARNNASLARALGVPLSAADPKECLKGLKTELIQRLEGIANSEDLALKGALNNLVKGLNPREDSEVDKPRSLLARITATKTGFRTPSLEARVGRDAQSFSVRIGAIKHKLSIVFSSAVPKP